jgi:5-(carboxyamino)imidazole ribonucleotide synthase
MIIGIIGGGQLARMLALAGIPMGLRFIFLDPAKDACAASLGEHLCYDYDDEYALEQLVERADIVTYEFEHIPENSLAYLEQYVPVHPNKNALKESQDRLIEKNRFQTLGVQTAPFAAVSSKEELLQAVSEIGLPAVLKTRTEGYDGKGQMVLRNDEDVELAWNKLGESSLILEGFVNFEREVSIIAARSVSGEMIFYPLTENNHVSGILHTSYNLTADPMQAKAEKIIEKMLDSLNYVGILTIELFQVGDNLIANEMAPRVHNSGHWTIEGAEFSQFENHLRAITDMPLGKTTIRGYSAMLNFVGHLPLAESVTRVSNTHFHSYDKKAKVGRKLGHATIRVNEQEQLAPLMEKLLTLCKTSE